MIVNDFFAQVPIIVSEKVRRKPSMMVAPRSTSQSSQRITEASSLKVDRDTHPVSRLNESDAPLPQLPKVPQLQPRVRPNGSASSLLSLSPRKRYQEEAIGELMCSSGGSEDESSDEQSATETELAPLPTENDAMVDEEIAVGAKQLIQFAKNTASAAGSSTIESDVEANSVSRNLFQSQFTQEQDLALKDSVKRVLKSSDREKELELLFAESNSTFNGLTLALLKERFWSHTVLTMQKVGVVQFLVVVHLVLYYSQSVLSCLKVAVWLVSFFYWSVVLLRATLRHLASLINTGVSESTMGKGKRSRFERRQP